MPQPGFLAVGFKVAGGLGLDGAPLHLYPGLEPRLVVRLDGRLDAAAQFAFLIIPDPFPRPYAALGLVGPVAGGGSGVLGAAGGLGAQFDLALEPLLFL